MENEKKKGGYSKYDCPYNEGCACQKMVCRRCGWNPEVHKQRMEKLMKGKVE